MKLMKHVKTRRLSLAGLGLVSVFVFGAVGSASAAQLLFKPHNTKFPYHLTGTGGESILETTGGAITRITSPAVHALVLATNSTLFNTHIEFLKVSSLLGKCHNDGATESILVDLLGHLGLADPGDVPAALLLVPNGFEFECGSTKIKVAGEVIGQITAPAINVSSELMRLVFKQNKGIQEFTTFLLGGSTLTEQFQKSTIGGGSQVQSGQSGEIDLKALPGQGTFLLLVP